MRAKMPVNRSVRESWEAYRRRILREVEAFIDWGLRHPEDVIEIPIKPADQGGFPAQVGQWFWSTVLSVRPGGAVRRWRDFLLRRPPSFVHRRARRL